MIAERKIAIVLGESGGEFHQELNKHLWAQGWKVMWCPSTQEVFALTKSNEPSVVFALVDGPLAWDELKNLKQHLPLVALGKFPRNDVDREKRPNNWQDWFEAWLDPNDGLGSIDRAAHKAMARRMPIAA